MSAPNKRLEYLRKLTASGSNDPMAWYGLAMEYRAIGMNDDALNAFKTLRERSPEYVAMYLMCGQLLQTAGKVEDAREWLQAGIEVATRTRNSHALGELESALAGLE